MPRKNVTAIALISLLGCVQKPAAAPPPRLAVKTHAEAPARQPTCERGSREAAFPGMAELSSADLITKYGTGLEAYQRQDGVWLPGLPLMVNEDFDFATSMALDGIGAGIAARKRIDGNAKSASELNGLRLAAGETERLDALRRCGVHVYGVIWTKDGVRELRVVTDVFEVRDGTHRAATHTVDARELKAQKLRLVD